MRRLWIGFVPYIAVSVVHAAALAVGSDAVAAIVFSWLGGGAATFTPTPVVIP